jgi:hypothetical protein
MYARSSSRFSSGSVVVVGHVPSALHGTSSDPAGSPLTSSVVATASGGSARRLSAVVTSARRPQFSTMLAMRRTGACGSSGTYAAPALSAPIIAITDSTALGK